MKKDLLIAVIAILVVAGVCFGLAAVRPPFQATPSHPYSTAPVGPSVNGHIVMRVNGQPITEEEFDAAFHTMPEEMQRQFANAPGKMAFAEQLVRMKLLEQEATRLGVEEDPKIAGQLAAERLDLLADAAATKMIPEPSEAEIKKYYDENKGSFDSVDISHILIAYAGGSVRSRTGGPAPSEAEAMNKALKIYDDLRRGANFGEEVRRYSDDVASAARDGELGPVAHGMLPPELEARVFQLPVGKFSSPIPSRLGIHIFKVNSRGAAPYQEIHARLAQRVRQQNMFDKVEIMREKANVVFDPKFFPDAKIWQQQHRKPS